MVLIISNFFYLEHFLGVRAIMALERFLAFQIAVFCAGLIVYGYKRFFKKEESLFLWFIAWCKVWLRITLPFFCLMFMVFLAHRMWNNT